MLDALGLREQEATVEAFGGAGWVLAAAGRAELGRCLALAAALWEPALDRVDRTHVHRRVGEVSPQAVGLAGRQTHAAAGDLHVQHRALGGAQQGDEVQLRHVEAGGQHGHVDEAADLALAECTDQLRPLALGRLGADHLGHHATAAQGVANVLGVLNRHGEHQPALALGRELHDLVAGGLDQRLGVGDLGQLADHVVVATGAHIVGVDAGDGGGRYQRGEEAQIQQLAHRDLGGHMREQGVVAGGQPDTVAPERGAGPADASGVRVVLGQILEEGAPHAGVLRVDQVAFVGQHDVDASELVGVLPDRADRGVGDLAAQILAAGAGAVQAHVGLWPDGHDLLDVLLQQLLLVHQHEDASARELEVSTLRQQGDHQGLAGTHAGLDDRVAAVVPGEPAPQLVERAALVWARDHETTFASMPWPSSSDLMR